MLELHGVSHIYPNGTRALDNVTLSIPRGMYGLLGPNGAGKSTLMRAIATLQTPSEGKIQFGDPSAGSGQVIDVIRQPETLRRTLGYLPQDFGVYPRVSAYDMLDHMAVLKGVVSSADRKITVEALLHQVNLWSVRKKMLSGFSGGMRQRFGIAQALIGNPRLIIVDEPTAGLDPAERLRFLNLLAELGQQAVVILSTHIVEDVSELCSRMAIINKGEIRLEADPLSAIADLRGRVYLKEVGRSELAAYNASHAVISTKLLAGRTVIRILADAAPGDGFSPIDPSLEDVYFAAMRSRTEPELAAALHTNP
jgi:ABC-2 type transport system ATP-binding protein